MRRNLHKGLDQIQAIQSVLHSDIRIGKKTATGGVRNLSDMVLGDAKLAYDKASFGTPEAKDR